MRKDRFNNTMKQGTSSFEIGWEVGNYTGETVVTGGSEEAYGEGVIKVKKEIYKGMFKDNMCDGLIHLTKRDGDVWIGEFKENILDGK